VQALKISENKRFLVTEDGVPFFWLADTAWELFNRLNREEVDFYLLNRAKKRFNVIQAVALAEFDGLRTGNAYRRKPFLQTENGEFDPSKPDLEGEYSYWDHVDYVVDKAESLGLYIALLPTWGDKYNIKWGKGPVIFSADNAFAYGEWIGKRYKHKSNIIWVLGGDRPLEQLIHYSIIRAMALGIKKGDEGEHLITFHPMGGYSSSDYVHDEKWLDFNMIQSGHGYDWDNYRKITLDYNKKPIKPTLDGEPRYEDHPINFRAQNGYYNDNDVRQSLYWSVFSGGFGVTYGHHSVWGINIEPGEYFTLHWRDALDRPAAFQVEHIRALLESRPFLERIPDQSLLVNELAWSDHIRATRGYSYIFAYTPLGKAIDINMGKITGDMIKASWFDPRTGKINTIGEYENTGVVKFIPPSSGYGNDWVLILDDANRNSAIIRYIAEK